VAHVPLSATTDRYPLLTGGGDMMTTMELASPRESQDRHFFPQTRQHFKANTPPGDDYPEFFSGYLQWCVPWALREAGRTPDNAWLIGYDPADKPTVAFAIFIHSGTFGGLTCTPVVKRILELYFTKYGRSGHVK